MNSPQELSIREIRKFMIDNGCKVTNHALVKHFKRFLTQPSTQNEARKQFKTYVNILATIKNENNQKFLILRKKYINECPTEEVVARAVAAASMEIEPNSPGGGSIISESGLVSPFRQPPPYKPPPDVKDSTVLQTGEEVAQQQSSLPTALATIGSTVQQENIENYRDCVNEFTDAIRRIDPARLQRQISNEKSMHPDKITRENSIEDDLKSNKENIPRFSFSSGTSATSGTSADSPDADVENDTIDSDILDNPISVKEATRKFNRMASEEEAKIISPPNKKKTEKNAIEDRMEPEVTLAHPKAKEWIVSMARANYQELAKLANEHPELVKLQDPSTGYTALHWAAKQGNEDVVKLIAGTYKADVNARSNGGYTPLHLAMQFRREEIFELLCNVYKANRDLMDWSGNKPLDYSKQRTSVSPSTYSKIQAMRQHVLSSGHSTRRNQGSEKANGRKRFGIPTDWLFERPSEEDNRSIQQLLGSGQWECFGPDGQWRRWSSNSRSLSPAISPTPSSSSSSSSYWYDTESSYASDNDDDHTIRDEQSLERGKIECPNEYD